MRPLNLIITGVGGQGNVLASQVVGQAAVKKGWRVTIGETFGLSQRGGAVMSHIRLSEQGNYGPLIPPHRGDVVLGLEPLETLRTVQEYGHEETLIIANSRPIHPLNVISGDAIYPAPERIRQVLGEVGRRLYWLDATDAALGLGGPIMLNMVMLGALCALNSFPLALEDLTGVIEALFPAFRRSANLEALRIGGEMVLACED